MCACCSGFFIRVARALCSCITTLQPVQLQEQGKVNNIQHGFINQLRLPEGMHVDGRWIGCTIPANGTSGSERAHVFATHVFKVWKDMSFN